MFLSLILALWTPTQGRATELAPMPRLVVPARILPVGVPRVTPLPIRKAEMGG